MTALTLSDGAKISVNIEGEGRPIVFVHGWSTRGNAFRAQSEAFAKSHQVVTLDLRGHGQSLGFPTPPTIEGLGADLLEIFEQLNLQDAVCVGWSMGAMVLWEAIARDSFAKRLSGLVIVDMSPRITNDASWVLGLADGRGPQATIRAADAMRRDWPAMVHQFVPRIFAPTGVKRLGELIGAMVNDACALDPNIMAGLWESMAVQDFRKLIGKIETPTLVMHGVQSQLYSKATSAFIVASSRNAALSSFQRSGHAPHLEEPDEFNRRLKLFIDQIDKQSVLTKPHIAAAR